jgi:beta-barrel assembly-enhancing protease
MSRKFFRWISLFIFIGGTFVACAEVTQVGTTIGQGMGKISPQDKEAIDRLAAQTEKAARPMTDEEEYYVGRAVAATILSQYRLWTPEPITKYINEVGQTVALSSDRPLTYGGYHFALLDSAEVNALACPGGTIFITRGMLKKAQNEEELASILAHEVGHVNHKDGLQAIQKSRWTQVVTMLGSTATQKLAGADLAKLISLFEGSVNDVVKTLVVTGYSRDQETAADRSALAFAHRAGYDPWGLPHYLEKLAKEQSQGANQGLFSTHPGMADRLTKAKALLAENKWPYTTYPIRDGRFQQIIQ